MSAAPRLARELTPQELAERLQRFSRAVWQLPTWRALCRFEAVAPYSFRMGYTAEKTLQPDWQARKDELEALHEEAVERLRTLIMEEGC